MKLYPRALASGVVALLVAAACGAGTGEGAATPAVQTAAAAPATQA